MAEHNCESLHGDPWSGPALDREVLVPDPGIGAYSIIEGGITQSYGQHGHEIIVNYIGPGDRKNVWAFLDKIFGKWRYARNAEYPCWDCLDGPSPYWIPLPVDYPNDVPQPFHADSYQITAYCGEPVVATASDVLPSNLNCELYDYDFRAPTPSGAPYVTDVADCVTIAVTYRARDGGIFQPRSFNDEVRGKLCICDENSPQTDPTIPCVAPCTFIEARTTRDFSIVTTPAGQWASSCTGTQGLDDDLGINVHVLTVKHDVVWSNVPSVNELYLERLSGSVNDKEFLGYPPEGVLFVYKDSIARTRWDGTVTYDVRMQFLAKMAPVYGYDDSTIPLEIPCQYQPLYPSDPDPCVYCGRIGIWNRSWFPTLCHACNIGGFPESTGTCTYEICKTNWHRVNAVGCNLSAVPPGCTDNIPTIRPFVPRDLTRIFLKGLGCCANEPYPYG